MVLCCVSILLASCDPVVSLYVQPIQQSQTRFRFITKKQYQPSESTLVKQSLAGMPSRSSIAYRLTVLNQQSDSLERVVIFNFGSWKEEHFCELAAVIDTLQITTTSGAQTIVDSAQIHRYLASKKKSGLFNDKITLP